MKTPHLILLILAILCMTDVYAQNNKLVNKGNKLYQEKKYPEATEAYKQALAKNPASTPGMFNLGNALFQQKNYEGARQVMAATAKNANDKQLKAGANYNVGNTYMQEKKWEDAINAYKAALRNNPQDEAAKYNLSYARTMMKKEQGGGGKDKNKNDKDQQKNDQQNKDNKQDKDQQKNQDQQNKEDKKDQQKQDQDKQDEQPQHPQPQPSKLTEQQADQLLNALQQEEKKLQDKKQKGKGIPVKVEKDW